MKKNCVNCMYLITGYPKGRFDERESCLGEYERDKIRNKDFSWKINERDLSCHYGVWSELLEEVIPNFATFEELTKERKICLFYPFSNELLLPGAVELQKHEAEYKAKSSSNRYTTIGLFIAAAGLLLNSIIQIIRLVLGK